MEEKECSRCEEVKPVSEFYTYKKGTKIRPSCRGCDNEMSRNYKANHKEEISVYNHEYKAEHKEEISEYNKQYNIENTERIQAKHQVYLKNKRETDENYKNRIKLHDAVYQCLTRGIDNARTQSVLGCDHDFFILWMEYQFNNKMSFDNYGTYWHIDHCDPCNTFDLTDKGDQKLCFHWSNTRPLKKTLNWSRSQDTDPVEIAKHNRIVKKFLKEFEEDSDNDYQYYYTKL